MIRFMKLQKRDGRIKAMNKSHDAFSLKFIDSFMHIEQTPIEKFIAIGPCNIKFVFYNNLMAEILIRPFQHLVSESSDKINFTIHAAEDSVSIPTPNFKMLISDGINDSLNQNLYFNTDTRHFLHNTLATITSLVDTQTRDAYYYIDSVENLPDYEKAAPFRMIFHWFGVMNNMNLIHGAVIANNGAGWLLAGKGGVGKSTMSLLSQLNGTPLLGDDYVLIENKDIPIAYSLYNSIKVNQDIIEKYPFLDQYLANRTSHDYDKGYLFADEIPGQGMTLSAKLKGIIMITGESSDLPSFNKIPRIKALSVIGSSTIFQMPGINRNFLRGIVELVNALDIREYILGNSIKENLAFLSDFIDESPLISVIMPIYNGADRIMKSIASVLNQTYTNIELIIIDDGSVDESSEIVKRMSDDRIKYYFQDNQGPAAARNKGISFANGRYIAFIDHDDTWYENKLEKQLTHMKNHSGLCVLYSRHNLIYKGSKENYIWPQKIKGIPRFNYELPSSMFIDRNVFHRIGVYNPTYMVLEDTELHLRILDSGIKMHTLDDYLLDKYIHGTDPLRNLAVNDLYIKRLFTASVKRKHFLKSKCISVIIPAYNPDEHLISCIKSILSQTLTPYEIVIADDGSKNDVAKLLSCFNEPRIKIFRQENKGISGARNFAISKATGNILAFIDSDDLWTEDKLQLQVERLISDSSVQAVFGCIRQFYSPEVDDAYRKKYYFKDEVTKGVIPGTLMILKEDFEKVGPFNENLRLGELFDWIHRFKKQGYNYTVLPDVMMYRRLHYNNNGILNKQDRIDFAKAFAQIVKDKKNERS